MTTKSNEEVCERVLPVLPGQIAKGSYAIARERLIHALSSGLLCDGKELESVIAKQEFYRKLHVKQCEEISSLKLKLREKDEKLAKLSGSCEGMTVEKIEKLVEEFYYDPRRDRKLARGD